MVCYQVIMALGLTKSMSPTQACLIKPNACIFHQLSSYFITRGKSEPCQTVVPSLARCVFYLYQLGRRASSPAKVVPSSSHCYILQWKVQRRSLRPWMSVVNSGWEGTSGERRDRSFLQRAMSIDSIWKVRLVSTPRPVEVRRPRRSFLQSPASSNPLGPSRSRHCTVHGHSSLKPRPNGQNALDFTLDHPTSRLHRQY
ncbi:hypothetical protein BDV19DRAFT_290581 [Aspergillus venezuelensis]